MDDVILGCEQWEGESVMLEGDCTQYYYSLQGGGADELETLVVLQGRPNVESLNALEVPQFAGGAFGVGDNAAAWRSHGCSFKVVRSFDTFPH